MAIRAKALIQYAIMLAVTATLVWFSLRAIHVEEGKNKWDYISETWSSGSSFWLLMMLVFVMISHVIRAERWRMLLRSTGNSTSLYSSFLSLMIGYLVNLVVPRGGEVSRCYNLYRLDRIPVEVSFGTVVVERIADVLCLVVVLVLAFAIESEKLFTFIDTIPLQFPGSGKALVLVAGLVMVAIIGLLLYRFIRRNERLKNRIQKIWKGFVSGLASVARLENRFLFLVYTISIWLLYFLMSYSVIKAFDQTAHLGFAATLTLFAIGTIAMAAPLPGGTGSYHVLLPAGMVLLYQIGQAEAVAFTFVFHGWQTLIMIVGGFISLILSSVRTKKQSSPQVNSD